MIECQSGIGEIRVLYQYIEGEEKNQITQFVISFLGIIGDQIDDYFKDKLFLAKLTYDVREAETKIKGLWEERLPRSLSQGLASIFSLLSVRPHLVPYYHPSILRDAVKGMQGKDASISEAVRKMAQNILEEAQARDKKPHFLLRDSSSSFITKEKQQTFELFSLSSIDDNRQTNHRIILYDKHKYRWISPENKKWLKNLEKMIDIFYCKDAIGIEPKIYSEIETGYYGT